MMYEYMIIASVMALLGATKKTMKPVFGQLTLTGDLAVDWVKHETKITARKIWFGSASLFDEYNLPEWAVEKGIVALIFPIDEYQNPLLVTQKSILKFLERHCCEWEAKGATVASLKRSVKAIVSEIQFDENEPTFEFIRDPKTAKQFDPYKVIIE